MSYPGPFPYPIKAGGTNAISMATTDGIIYYDGTSLVTTSAGSSGQVLTSQGAGVAPVYSSAGAWVFISKGTAVGSASLTFTIPATYNNFVLIISNLIVANDLESVFVQLSNNGGSSYISSGYFTGAVRNAYNAATWANVNLTSGVLASYQVHNTAAGANATMYLYNLTSGTIAATHSVATVFRSGTGLFQDICTGVYATNITVNAIKVSATSGNLTSGTVSLYGIRES